MTPTHTQHAPATATTTHRAGRAYELLTAVSMTVGRRPAAHLIADLAQLAPDDRVIDIGCGPGTAARVAARRAATVAGIDPSPTMLRLGRWLTTLQHVANLTLIQGTAEDLTLPDASATVVWALSSVHHWNDRPAGLAEAHRVLAPGGRILLAERLVTPRRPRARHPRPHPRAGGSARHRARGRWLHRRARRQPHHPTEQPRDRPGVAVGITAGNEPGLTRFAHDPHRRSRSCSATVLVEQGGDPISGPNQRQSRFAYFYLRKNEPDRVRVVAPSHVAHWQQLEVTHHVGGPFEDHTGEPITFDADDVTAQRAVRADPFVKEDLVEAHWLKQWTPE